MTLFLLFYIIVMLGWLTTFIYYNRTYKWVTKRMYDDDFIIGLLILTIIAIVLYPITLLVALFMYIWKQFIPDN